MSSLKLYNLFINERVENISFVAFFRISIGLFVMIHFLSIWGDFNTLFGSEAIINTEIQNINRIFIDVTDISNFLINNLNINFENSILLIKLIYLFLTILIVIGYQSRVSAFFLILLHASIFKANPLLIYGVDYITSISLFYIAIFPSDSTFSIKNLIKPVKIDYKYLGATKIFFQIHISIIYFFSGLEKALGFNWWNGESIWKAINLPNFYNDFNINYSILNQYSFVFVIIGISVIIIELFYPLFMNLRMTKNIWLTLTISMHLGILVSLNLYFFSTIMIIWNITAYYFKNETT